MFEDSDLRKLLTNFRETVIYAETADNPDTRRYCILRRGMIDHLIASKPEGVREWHLGTPGHLLRHTEPDHWRSYAPRIIDLVRRVVRA